MQENSAQTKKLVGIEVKTSEVIAVCLDQNGGVIDSFKSPFEMNADVSGQIVGVINRAEERFGKFEKLGIAVPGLLNRKTNTIAFSTRMPDIANVDLRSVLETETGLKIYIKNDANAAAFAEHLFGAGRSRNNLFYVTLGTGIGGALILDNKLWHGKSGFAGEFGYIAINSEGMKLEDFASSVNILRRTKSWLYKDYTSSLHTIGEENITIADIVDAAKNEDDFAELMLQRTGTYIGTAIASVINLLNIETIVVGGEIMEAGEIVLDAIIHRAKELSFKPSFESVDIVAGDLGENASAIGVAFLSDQEV